MYNWRCSSTPQATQQSDIANHRTHSYLTLTLTLPLLTLQAAINVYMEALEHSPDNAEILTTVGLLFLRVGDNSKAFDYLGNSIVQDPKNMRTILAAGALAALSAGSWNVSVYQYKIEIVK